MVRIFSGYEGFSRAAAEYIVQAGQQSIAGRRRFDLVLSGGSTPRGTYEKLVEMTRSQPGFWESTHIYWGDERCVPNDHEQSNYHGAALSLLDLVQVPPDQIHSIIADDTDFAAAAERYDGEFPSRPDLLLLGVGADGHTASLFPGSPALQESKNRFALVEAPVEPKLRITLTPPVIAAARNILVLTSGANKAAAVRRAFAERGTIRETPARLLRTALWYIDTDAGEQLPEHNANNSAHQRPGETREW